MSIKDDVLGGFVLDPGALDELAGADIYAATFADRAAVRGIVLIVPATALSESWHSRRRGSSQGHLARSTPSASKNASYSVMQLPSWSMGGSTKH